MNFDILRPHQWLADEVRALKEGVDDSKDGIAMETDYNSVNVVSHASEQLSNGNVLTVEERRPTSDTGRWAGQWRAFRRRRSIDVYRSI